MRTNFCWPASCPGKTRTTGPKANARSPNPESRAPSPSCWHVVLRTIVRVIAGPAAKARRTFLRAAGGALAKVPNLPEHFYASSLPCIKKPPPKRGEVYPVRKPDNARAGDSLRGFLLFSVFAHDFFTNDVNIHVDHLFRVA